MGRPVYNWIIVFESGATDIIKAEDVVQALEQVQSCYYEVITAVVKG